LLLQHAPALSGGVAADSVSHPINVVMGTDTAQMAVMNSSVVSTSSDLFFTSPLIKQNATATEPAVIVDLILPDLFYFVSTEV